MKVKIEKKKKNIMSMSVLLLIVGFCALRKFKLFLYFAQLLFILCALIHYIKKKTIRLTGYSMMYGLFTIFAMMSIAWSESTSNAISALRPLLQLVIIGVILVDYIDNREKVDMVFKFFLISSIALLIFLFLMTPQSVWVAAMKVSQNASSAADRIGPSIGFQANWMGIICAFSIIIWIYYYSKSNKNKKMSLLIISILSIIVIFTKSRKAFIILIFGPMMYWLLYKPRKKYILFIIPGIILVVFASIWAVFNVPFLYKMIGFRLIGLFSVFDPNIVVDASVTTRADMVKIGIELFKQNPIGGVGFGNFSHHYFYNYSGWTETYAHNNYVELLADTGMIGFTLYYAIPLMMVFTIIKNWNEFTRYDRKLTAFLFTFVFIRLIMDYGMVVYDDEFVQIITVNCYCAIRCLKAEIRQKQISKNWRGFNYNASTKC